MVSVWGIDMIVGKHYECGVKGVLWENMVSVWGIDVTVGKHYECGVKGVLWETWCLCGE